MEDGNDDSVVGKTSRPLSMCTELYPHLVTEDVAREEQEELQDKPSGLVVSLLDCTAEGLTAEDERCKEEPKAAEKVRVKFSVVKRTEYGSVVYLTGSVDELGCWDVENSNCLVRMEWTEGNVWRQELDIAFVERPFAFEYKYYVRPLEKTDEIKWEDGVNHMAVYNSTTVHEVSLQDKWASSGVTKIEGDRVDRLNRTRSQAFSGLLDMLTNPFQMRTVRFRCHVKTSYGDVVYVCGNTAQLGEWQKTKAVKMHYVGVGKLKGCSLWEGDVAMRLDQMQFEYKYFVWKADGSRCWERGIDGNRKAMTWMKQSSEKDTIIFEDGFECNNVQFSIYYPTRPDETLHVTGDPEAIGSWFMPGPVPMHLGEKEQLETDVEGQKWVLDVFMPQATKSFQYRYVLVNSKTSFALWEREPNRRANLAEMRPVNSTYCLRDVNFVAGMEFDPCSPDMFIGPYPQTPEDIDLLKKAGVTAVLNVQTDEDFRHRNIDWDLLERHYKELGIEVVRYEIRDFDRASLRERLMGAVRILDRFHMEGKKSYIHCTAGMGRAPATVVAYLVWVKKWELEDAVRHVKTHRKVAVPNVPVLEDALQQIYTLY